MAEEFDGIVREYQDRIFRLAFSMLGDRSAAEEIAQDVLVRVWKGLPGFRAESSLSTWIYAITRNSCLTAMGRRDLRPVSLDDPTTRREAESQSACRAASGFSDAAELINRLPAKYRQVMVLFYMQEKSYDDVARMLNLPVGTVRTYLFRARSSLAKELARGRVANERK